MLRRGAFHLGRNFCVFISSLWYRPCRSESRLVARVQISRHRQVRPRPCVTRRYAHRRQIRPSPDLYGAGEIPQNNALLKATTLHPLYRIDGRQSEDVIDLTEQLLKGSKRCAELKRSRHELREVKDTSLWGFLVDVMDVTPKSISRILPFCEETRDGHARSPIITVQSVARPQTCSWQLQRGRRNPKPARPGVGEGRAVSGRWWFAGAVQGPRAIGVVTAPSSSTSQTVRSS